MTRSEKGGASRVAKVQCIVVRLREQKIAGVRGPPRRILEGVLCERGEQTQALRHLSELAVLQPFGVEQQPMMDVAVRHARGGRRVYAALVLSGVATNLLALGSRAAFKVLGLDLTDARPFDS